MLNQGHAAGLDVGGTKIATQVFDRDWMLIDEWEVPTPHDSYAVLLDEIVAQIELLHRKHDSSLIPTGIGLPGIVDLDTDTALTANLAASGHPLRHDILDRLPRVTPVLINDCRAFTLSEALLGAGRGHKAVLGLIIGTGLAGGLVLHNQLIDGKNGAAGEYGHIPIAADLLQRYSLPILNCGCGRSGCYETLCSGSGLSRIAKHLTGHEIETSEFGKPGIDAAPELQRCFAIWIDLLSELLATLCLTVDPGCVVLGGGASQIAGLVSGLSGALDRKLMTGMTTPIIRLAQGGPKSGARGAALAAIMAK